MATKKKKPFRYTTQTVRRYWGRGGPEWELVAEYDDATVRDQGTSGWLNAREAMLRAYSSDPNFYGDEDYQQGNGIAVWTQENEDKYTDPKNKYGGAPGNFIVGAVYDCDGDLALKRIMMNVVISSYNYGHGAMEYIGFVAKSDDPDRRGEEYDGWGYKDGGFRIEKWRVEPVHEP